MADLKITAMTSLAATAIRADLLHVIDDPTGTPINKKVTIGEMLDAIHGPVDIAAANSIAISAVANGGRTSVINDHTGVSTITLPTPSVGLSFHFIYGGAAAEAQDHIITTGANAKFFKGGITHLDQTADENALAVFSDNDSNSKLTLNNMAHLDLHFLGASATVYFVWGFITSDTVPAFADQ